MSGVGFWELVILFLIGLVVLGPERLPRVANQLGAWLGQARRMTRMMKRQLEDELNLEEGLNLNSIGKPYSPPQPAAAKPAGSKPASVTQPTYVHDQPAPGADKPDDYSPAHGPGDTGVGVGDDPAAVAESKPQPGAEAGEATQEDGASKEPA